MIVKKSRLAFSAATLSTIAIVIEFLAYRERFGIITTNDGSTMLGMAIGAALILPHIVMFVLACIFAWIGYGTDVSGLTLTSGILHCVALVFGLQNWQIVILPLILSFTGYAEQKRLREKEIDHKNNEPKNNNPVEYVTEEANNDYGTSPEASASAEKVIKSANTFELVCWVLLGIVLIFTVVSIVLISKGYELSSLFSWFDTAH